MTQLIFEFENNRDVWRKRFNERLLWSHPDMDQSLGTSLELLMLLYPDTIETLLVKDIMGTADLAMVRFYNRTKTERASTFSSMVKYLEGHMGNDFMLAPYAMAFIDLAPSDSMDWRSSVSFNLIKQLEGGEPDMDLLSSFITLRRTLALALAWGRWGQLLCPNPVIENYEYANRNLTAQYAYFKQEFKHLDKMATVQVFE